VIDGHAHLNGDLLRGFPFSVQGQHKVLASFDQLALGGDDTALTLGVLGNAFFWGLQLVALAAWGFAVARGRWYGLLDPLCLALSHGVTPWVCIYVAKVYIHAGASAAL
jgi:hypothetical protein